MPRWIIILLAVLVTAAAAFALFVWFIISEVKETFAPAAPNDVYILRDLDLNDADYALILHPVITGDTARIIRDKDVLIAAQNSVYFTDKESFGQIIGMLALTIMGGEALVPVATVLRDGATIDNYDCHISFCQPDGNLIDGYTRDFSALEGLGTPVTFANDFYYDYDQYRAAHAEIVTNPDIYFAIAGSETLGDTPDNLLRFELRLPSAVWPIDTETGQPRIDIHLETDNLKQILSEALIGSDAQLENLVFSWPPALRVVDENQQIVQHNGAELQVRSITFATPLATIAVAPEHADALQDLLPSFPRPEFYQSLASAALGAAIEGVGACHDCGYQITPQARQIDASLSPIPQSPWHLKTIIVEQDQP